MSDKDSEKRTEAENFDDELSLDLESQEPLGNDDLYMDELEDYDDPLLEPLDHDEQFEVSDDDSLDQQDGIDATHAAPLDDDFVNDGQDDFQEFDQFDDFGDDWEQSDAEKPAGSKGKPSLAAGKLQDLMQNNAVKYGVMGVGGVAAVAALYIFGLGGSIPGVSPSPAPRPIAQNNAAPAPTGNDEGIRQALNAGAQQNPTPIEPVSLFDNLDALPTPDAPPQAPIITKDGEDLGDVFSILENDVPSNDPVIDSVVDSAPADTGATSSLDMPSPQNDALSDFAALGELPMPTPIGSPSPAESEPSVPMEIVEAQQDVSPLDPITPNMAADMEDSSNPFDVFERAAGDNSSVPSGERGGEETIAPIDMPLAAHNAPAESVLETTVTSDNAGLSQLNQQLVALNSRMEDMSRRMDRLENGASNSGASSSDLSRLESAIERLEKRIERLADQGTTMARNESSSRSSSVQKASTPPANAATSASSSVSKASAPKKASPSAAKSWELRGASPTNAFIARKNGGALQTVRVGDQVAGLGTIRFIGLEQGSWVVKTSGGTIRQ